MKPATLLSFALAVSLGSAQFVTSVTKAAPALNSGRAVVKRDGEDDSSAAKTATKTTSQVSTKVKATSSTSTTKVKATTKPENSTKDTTTKSTTTPKTKTTTSDSDSQTATSTPTTTQPSNSDTQTSGTATSTSTDTSTATPDPSPSSSGLSAGAAAGIAVAGVVGVFAIAGAAFLLWRKRRGGLRGAVVTTDYPHSMSPDSQPLTPSPGPRSGGFAMPYSGAAYAPSRTSSMGTRRVSGLEDPEMRQHEHDWAADENRRSASTPGSIPSLPSFMIPGGGLAPPPGGRPIPRIAVGDASPKRGVFREDLPERDAIELPA